MIFTLLLSTINAVYDETWAKQMTSGPYQERNVILQDALRRGDPAPFHALMDTEIGWGNVDDFGEGFGRFGAGKSSQKKLFEHIEQVRDAKGAAAAGSIDGLNQVAELALAEGNRTVFDALLTPHGNIQNVKDFGSAFTRFADGEEGRKALYEELLRNAIANNTSNMIDW